MPCLTLGVMPFLQHQRVRLPEGDDLPVIDFGGQGPDVLLVHHLGLGPLEWTRTIDALGGRVRAVAPALRGHMASTVPAVPSTVASADLHLVAQEFGLTRPVLVLAGWIAAVMGLSAAVQRPEAFSAVVTINGTIAPTRAQAQEEIEVVRSPQMLAYFRDRFRLDSVVPTSAEIEELAEAKVAAIMADWMVDAQDEVRAEVDAGLRRVEGGWTTSPSSQSIMTFYDLDADDPCFPTRDLYAQLQVPLDVVHGTESWDYRSEWLEYEIGRDDPPIRVTELDSGQFPMYSHPNEIARLILRSAGLETD